MMATEQRLDKVEAQVAALTNDLHEVKRDTSAMRDELGGVKTILIRMEEASKAQAHASPKRSAGYWVGVSVSALILISGTIALGHQWFASEVRQELGPTQLVQEKKDVLIEKRVSSLESYFVVKPQLREWVTIAASAPFSHEK